MSLLRRRRAEAEEARPSKVDDKAVQSEAAESHTRSGKPTFDDLGTRIDEAMMRIDRIEAKLADLTEALTTIPSHSDVMEVRMHSAKLAAELARATVELRGEIGMASDEARRAARLARPTDYETGEVPVTLPVDVDLSEIKPIDDKPKTAGKKRRTA